MEAPEIHNPMKWSNLERIVHPTWPALALLASLTIVVYAIPRGLDLTDESLYVLLAQTDAPRSLSVIHSQLLFQGLESITGVTLGIRGLRAARLALLLISTSWLAWVLSRSVGQEKKALFLSAALAFCFLQYTGNGRIFSLGYNSINWTCGAVFLASWVRWVRDARPRAPLGMGVALAVMWITKFPSAVLMGGLGILVAMFHPEVRGPRLFRAMGLALIPFIGIMILAPLGGHEVWPWAYLDTMAASQDEKHATGSLLLHSLKQIARAYLPLVPVAILGILGRRHRARDTHDTWVIMALTGAFVGVACLDLMTLRNFRMLYWWLSAALLTWSWSRAKSSSQRLAGLLFLLAPIGLTMGTDVGWPGHLMPVSGLMFIAALWLAPKGWGSLACLAVPLLILPDIGLHPYRQAPLSKASHSLVFRGTGETLLLSSAAQHYLDSIQWLTAPYPVPLIGSDRFYGEMLSHSPHNVSGLLWSAESLAPTHIADWNDHDSLLFGLCNSTERQLFQDAMDGFEWTPLGKVDRRPYLNETGRYGWGIPAQNAHVELFLLTQSP